MRKMMKIKVISYWLLFGLLLTAATPAADFGLLDEVLATPREAPASVGSRAAPSIAGGETSLDPFTVHPANRWTDETSGTFSETLANGELSWEGFDTSSSSMLRTRAAGTVDDTIGSRWRLNSTEGDGTEEAPAGSDFEIPIQGLNVTTSEGTGNASLNAYQWNSTHYTIRPAMTTADGTNWRSWNIESDYQDFSQMEGLWGADGWDFLEGTDEWDELNAADFDSVTASLGSLIGDVRATEVTSNLAIQTLSNDLSIFTTFTYRVRANRTINHSAYGFGNATGFFVLNTTDQPITTSWQTFTFTIDLTDAGIIDTWFIAFQDDVGDFEGNEEIFIDYVWLTTNNDSSDFTFFSYEEYYRAELEYNLRRSELSYLLLDDTSAELAEEKIGEFSVADYFDADELIPDIFQAEVGSIDYLFAGRTAGANATITWDYYEGEFRKFGWTIYDEADPPDYYAPYGISDEGVASDTYLVEYRLTVPEFDSCSGTVTIFEKLVPDEVSADFNFTIYSVNPGTGALTQQSVLWIHPWSGGPGNYYRATMEATNISQFDCGDGRTDWASAGFTFSYNKVAKQIEGHATGLDTTGEAVSGFLEVTVPATESNEFVLEFSYWVDRVVGGPLQLLDRSHLPTLLGTSRISIIVDGWSLAFQDLFGDIVKPIPVVGDLVSGGGGLIGGALDFLLAPLVAILNEMGKVFGALGNVVSSLGSVLAGLVTIIAELTDIQALLGVLDTAIGTVGTAVGLVETAVGSVQTAVEAVAAAVVDGLDDLITDVTAAVNALAADIFNAFETILDSIELILTTVAEDIIDYLLTLVEDFIDAVVSFFDIIFTAVIGFLRDWEIAGITLGDPIDVGFEFLTTFFTTLDDVLSFTSYVIATYATLFIILIFLFGIIGPVIAAQHPGEVIPLSLKYYSINLLPFSILGFRVHLPLGLVVIPFVVLTILGVNIG